MTNDIQITEHAYKKPHCPECGSLSVFSLSATSWDPWDPPGLGSWKAARSYWLEPDSELHHIVRDKKWCADCDWKGSRHLDWWVYDPAADREKLFEQRGWSLMSPSPTDYDQETNEYWAFHQSSGQMVGPHRNEYDAIKDVVANHLELVGTAKPT
jgi:hypothetical protein